VKIPADRNVTKKEAEKKPKYSSLCIEVQRLWNMKCVIVEVDPMNSIKAYGGI
jgi:hypothetical protein